VPLEPGALTLIEDDRRVLAVWASDCAERTLPLFEAVAPHDARPRGALEGVRAFARGESRIGAVRKLAADAHAAAREVENPAAVAAARASGHAAAVAHMASHAVGAPAYAALATRFAAGESAADEYFRWAVQHASSDVRRILRKLPARPQSQGPLAKLVYDLHVALTAASV